MAVTQYIGARYVPKFYENSDGTEEWRAGVEYEPLTIVTYNGNSYTSKKPVPSNIGNPSDNTTYWASTGNYNQQVEAYRQEVQEYKADVDELESSVNETLTNYRNRSQSLAYRRFVFIGDSYAEGYTPDGTVTGWCNIVVSALGLATSQYGIWYRGGAGFVANTQGRNFLGLLNDSSMTDPESVTDVVVAGGYNDNNESQANIQAAIATFCTTCRQKYPNAKIWIGEIGWSGDASKIYNLSRTVRNYIEGANAAGAAYMANVQYAMHEYFKSFATDKIHANAHGQDRIAKAVTTAILGGAADVYFAYESCAFTNPITETNNLGSISCILNNNIVTVCSQNQLNLTFSDSGHDFGGASGATLHDLGTFSAGCVIGSPYNTFSIPVHATVRIGSNEYYDVPAALIIKNGHLYLTLKKVNAAGTSWQNLNGVMYVIIDRFSATFDSLMC